MTDRHTATLVIVCTVGMVVGLVIDYRDGRLATLAALCSPGDLSLLQAMRLHWNELPAMHLGMSVGSLMAIPFGLLRTILCYSLMLLGMELALVFTQQLSAPGGSATMMIGGMTAGMLITMLIGCPPALSRRL